MARHYWKFKHIFSKKYVSESLQLLYSPNSSADTQELDMVISSTQNSTTQTIYTCSYT